MSWFTRKNRQSFKKAAFRESPDDCPNPGRGWYRIFSMDAADGAPLEEWQYSQGAGETLALLLVDLHAFANGEIPDESLAHIRDAFLFFQKEEKELLLRFVYDREGKGMEKEPAELCRILRHMEQLAPLLQEFGDRIFCIQGLFVGSWGEMHDSRFLTGTALEALWQRIYSLTPESCFFAVRRPAQWRMLTGCPGGLPDFASESETPAADSLEQRLRQLRLGLFNDGLLGSETDLGTYGIQERERSIAFQERLCLYVPNGGEAVGKDACGETGRAADYFRRIHVSYLNSVYDEKVLNRWKNSSFCGENGYAYIGKHLGYRFVVTDACLITTNMTQKLQIELENRGFAPIYEACGCTLRVEANGTQNESPSDPCGTGQLCPSQPADLRQLLPGGRMLLEFLLTGREDGNLYLFIYRKKDHRPIRTANAGAGDGVAIGRLRSRHAE